MTIMNEIEKMYVDHAIIKLFNNSYFDVGKIKSVLDYIKIIPNEKLMKQWEMMHCVHYISMDVKLREHLFNSVMTTVYTNKLQPFTMDLIKTLQINGEH